MLRTGVADELRTSLTEDGYLFPDYGGYCFAGVPATGLSVLGADVDHGPGCGPLPGDVFGGVDASLAGGDVDVVVVALVDGYGFEQYRRDLEEYPFLELLADRGTVTPLTSIYPSETAAAITTTHTATLPSRHGVLGWDQYVEPADAVVQTLPFETPADEPAGEVHGLDPAVLLDATSLYADLPDDVDATAVVPEGLLGTAYSEVAQDGLAGEEYGDLAGAAAAIQGAVEDADGTTYVYAYFNHVDSAAHAAGTESDAYREQLAGVLSALEAALVEGLDGATAERTLLLLTADHGEVDTPGVEGNFDLRDGRFDPLWDALRRGGDGEVIPPVGGPRNVQLHVRDGQRGAVRDLLERELDALVLDRETVLERELFGPGEPSALFRERLGDLVVVPRDLSVWHDPGLEYVGMHGGLHPEEMLVPFGAARVDRLQG